MGVGLVVILGQEGRQLEKPFVEVYFAYELGERVCASDEKRRIGERLFDVTFLRFDKISVK